MAQDTQSPTQSIDDLCTLVGTAAAAFFWAEEGQNPAVKTYWDALHYVATSLSVGYANFFPVTPLGKTIASAVQMLGPALSAQALDSLKPKPAPETDPALLAKLDAILEELKRIQTTR